MTESLFIAALLLLPAASASAERVKSADGAFTVELPEGWSRHKLTRKDAVVEAGAGHKYLAIRRLPRKLAGPELYKLIDGVTGRPSIALIGPGVKFYFYSSQQGVGQDLTGVFTWKNASYEIHTIDATWGDLGVVTDSIAGGPLKTIAAEDEVPGGVAAVRPRIVLAAKSGFTVEDPASGADRKARWQDADGRKSVLIPQLEPVSEFTDLGAMIEMIMNDKLAEYAKRGFECAPAKKGAVKLPNGWMLLRLYSECARQGSGMSPLTAAIDAGKGRYFTSVATSMDPAGFDEVLGGAALAYR